MTGASARRLTAEAVGTFALVFFGCGAIMVDADGGDLGHVGVSLAFGLVVMLMVFAIGHTSGAHINPAVTLALATRRRFAWRDLPGYWVAQAVGAIGAAFALRASLGDVADLGATAPSGSDAQSFAWEALMTGTLVFVILAVVTNHKVAVGAAAVAIGATIALASLVGGPISGASLNPARSLGPALVSGELGSLWIYLIAPLLGGVLGALLFERVNYDSPLDLRP